MTRSFSGRSSTILAALALLLGGACAGGQASKGKGSGDDDPGAGGAGETGGQSGSAGSGGSAGTGGRGGSGGRGGTGGATTKPDAAVATGGQGGTGSEPVVPPPDAGTPGAGDTSGPAPDLGSMPMDPPKVEEPLPPCKRTVMAANSGDLATALGGAQAGDCIVLADGEYQIPTISAKGTEANPIVVKAANTLKAVVTSGSVTIDGGAYVVVQGLFFRSSGAVRMNNCDHCRITRFKIQRMETGNDSDWISVGGTSKYCRIDHNELGPQNVLANMVMLSGSGAQIVQYTRIDHNHFHDVRGGGGNGWETIRAGLSGWTFSKAFTTIERNLFVNTTGDPETISVKSSDNIIRYNTMRRTNGQFTLRHGNRTSVYGNYILGDGVAGSSGMRVYGGDHKIYNNYIAGTSGAGINIDAGNSEDDSGMLTDHKVSYNVQVVFNTVVTGRGITVGSGKSIQPRNITVAYNLLQGAGPAISITGGTTAKLLGNVVNGGSAGVAMGVTMMDPKLVKMGDIFRITAGSPVIDLGDATMFPFVTEDMDGQLRAKADVGADEMATGPMKYGLLKETDVGPFAP